MLNILAIAQGRGKSWIVYDFEALQQSMLDIKPNFSQ
jgi:hypothetical protein